MNKINFDNFVQRRKKFYIFSTVLIGLGLLAVIYSLITTGIPLRLGVDFLGGTRFELQFEEPISEDEIRAVFAQFGITNPSITALQGQGLQNAWQIRAPFVSAEEVQAIDDALNNVSPIAAGTLDVTTMSPAVGREVTRAAIIAVVVSATIILVYIMAIFRQVPNSFRYGVCAVTAMIHDLFIITGFAAITGMILGWEVDALFLTGVLTVVGFSLQDTIVVFDRIRENLGRRPNQNIEPIANKSIAETFKRSVITQLSAMFVMVAILLFGGDSVKPFIAVLFIGLLSGTYSSIFIATPLLVSWDKGEIPLTQAHAR